MIKDDMGLLRALFSDACGKAAFDRLFISLATETNISKCVNEENKFLIEMAHIFKERLPTDNFIQGDEENSHKVLHCILVEYREKGQSGLEKMKADFSP